MAGIVFVDEQKVDKPGTMIADTAKVEGRGHDLKYVSRGGLKLEKAMEVFPLTPRGKVCMDIGASTGGFTDCMLQNGAVKVYACLLYTSKRLFALSRDFFRSSRASEACVRVTRYSTTQRRCRRCCMK